MRSDEELRRKAPDVFLKASVNRVTVLAEKEVNRFLRQYKKYGVHLSFKLKSCILSHYICIMQPQATALIFKSDLNTQSDPRLPFKMRKAKRHSKCTQYTVYKGKPNTIGHASGHSL